MHRDDQLCFSPAAPARWVRLSSTKPEAWETNAAGPFLTINSPRGPVSLHSLGGDRYLLTGPDHEQEITGFEMARQAARELAGVSLRE